MRVRTAWMRVLTAWMCMRCMWAQRGPRRLDCPCGQVGASDVPLLDFCNGQHVPAAAISPELDVWTHTRRPRAAGSNSSATAAYELKTQWKYYRHHNSDFLEMGLVKVAFLWELVSRSRAAPIGLPL